MPGVGHLAGTGAQVPPCPCSLVGRRARITRDWGVQRTLPRAVGPVTRRAGFGGTWGVLGWSGKEGEDLRWGANVQRQRWFLDYLPSGPSRLSPQEELGLCWLCREALDLQGWTLRSQVYSFTLTHRGRLCSPLIFLALAEEGEWTLIIYPWRREAGHWVMGFHCHFSFNLIFTATCSWA